MNFKAAKTLLGFIESLDEAKINMDFAPYYESYFTVGPGGFKKYNNVYFLVRKGKNYELIEVAPFVRAEDAGMSDAADFPRGETVGEAWKRVESDGDAVEAVWSESYDSEQSNKIFRHKLFIKRYI